MSFPYWDTLINIGRCVKPHGIKGEIGVKPITDFPERFFETEAVFAHKNQDPVKPLIVEAVRPHSGGFLLKFKGVDSKSQAEKLRGLFLAVTEDELVVLEEDEFWHWELEGMAAVDPEGRAVGELIQVVESPAHDLYMIRTPQGEEHLIPAVREFVPEIDREKNQITVVLPEIID